MSNRRGWYGLPATNGRTVQRSARTEELTLGAAAHAQSLPHA